jgi:putative DNA methylase
MTVYRKKLIEVALPLAAINAESAREKSIRHGHPSTLHLWWARRPLAACRAVLFSSLVDDPDSDPQYRRADGKVDEEAAGIKRGNLFNLIEELVMWENANNQDVIRSARAEIARCIASRLIETGKLKKDTPVGGKTTAWDLVTKGHCRPRPMGLYRKVGRVRFSMEVDGLPPADVVNAFLAEHGPPVLDPFAGGGSIPLEAQRLGLRAYASDLNPVPVLINKALIEIPPKFAGKPPVNPGARGGATLTKGKGKSGKALIEKEWPGATGLAEDVRYYGQWIRDEAEKRIGHLYPKVEVTAAMAEDRPDLLNYVGQKLTVIAWLWARTVASPNPAAKGAHVPLIRSFWLSTKADKKVWVEPVVDRAHNCYEFKIRLGNGAPRAGTVGRSGGTCLLTESLMPLDYIRAEGKAGRIGARLMVIVVDCRGGRVYIPASGIHERIADGDDPHDVPDTDLPEQALGFRIQNYGMVKHRHLFTRRQLVALTTFCDLLGEARELLLVHSDGDRSYANAIATYLGLGIGRLSDICNSLCGWETSKTQVRHLFTRHAISMLWDFGENNVFGNAAGDFGVSVENLCRAIDRLPATGFGYSEQRSAEALETTSHGYLFSTDPPYYDNVPYADLSDFFYVWLRRCLHSIYPELLGTVLVPKAEELVAEPFRHGGREQAREFFERGMERVLRRVRVANNPNYPTTIYYAFKQSEGDDDDDVTASHSSTGWETFLQGLVEAGWQIAGTWPMRTELANRMRGIGSNALASSIVLVCRPRPENAPLVTRKEFITALRRELPVSLRNLQRGNIAPVDLAQAAIGPGMAIFTRYSKVVESDGSLMTVRTALGLINQSLDEVLAEQEGEFDGDTRWALSWFEQFGMDDGPFGDAETLSKAKNTAIKGLQEAGLIVAKAGKVRLVKRDELPDEWRPATDKRLTVWEVTQHLIRRLDKQGETGAAELVGQLGGIAEVARDLAYRLYSTCERRKWAQEALAYNSLVVAWPELTRLASAQKHRSIAANDRQQELF